METQSENRDNKPVDEVTAREMRAAWLKGPKQTAQKKSKEA